MTEKLAQRFADQTARIDKVVVLAALADSADVEVFEDLLELAEAKDLVRLFGMPQGMAETMITDGDVQELWDWCATSGRYGFLLGFATPVMKKRAEGHHSYSWGSFYSHWVYGDTWDEALEAGFAWVDERRAAEGTDTTGG